MATRSQIASPSSSSSSSNLLPSKLESLSLKETNINNNFAEWLQLPDNLTEKILERLPVPDYVRFGAVCPQWLSIQENHRRRHATSPPPIFNLPWFIPCEPQQDAVDCFSPFEQRSHRIRLPLSRRYLKHGIESEGRSWQSYGPNGWLALEDVPWDRNYYFTLLNPFSFSGVQIKLPREGYGLYTMGCKLTVSPPPGWFVFLMAEDKWTNRIRLFREGDDFWTELEFPDYDSVRGMASLDQTCAIVWEGKVYYMYLGYSLMVIDPLPRYPTIEFLEMDQSQLPTIPSFDGGFIQLFMLEFNGKMLLVVEFFNSQPGYNDDSVVVGFQVFEADFSNKRWVRLDSLGDRVLFIHHKFVCSMLADDIGVEGNCIYCQDPSKIQESYRQNSARAGPIPWSVFSLGTGKLTDSPLSHVPTPYTHRMFMPSLC